jgi:hypothetical protein
MAVSGTVSASNYVDIDTLADNRNHCVSFRHVSAELINDMHHHSADRNLQP